MIGSRHWRKATSRIARYKMRLRMFRISRRGMRRVLRYKR